MSCIYDTPNPQLCPSWVPAPGLTPFPSSPSPRDTGLLSLPSGSGHGSPVPREPCQAPHSRSLLPQRPLREGDNLSDLSFPLREMGRLTRHSWTGGAGLEEQAGRAHRVGAGLALGASSAVTEAPVSPVSPLAHARRPPSRHACPLQRLATPPVSGSAPPPQPIRRAPAARGPPSHCAVVLRRLLQAPARPPAGWNTRRAGGAVAARRFPPSCATRAPGASTGAGS